MSSGAVFSGPALPQRLLKNRNLVFRHTLLKSQPRGIFTIAQQRSLQHLANTQSHHATNSLKVKRPAFLQRDESSVVKNNVFIPHAPGGAVTQSDSLAASNNIRQDCAPAIRSYTRGGRSHSRAHVQYIVLALSSFGSKSKNAHLAAEN